MVTGGVTAAFSEHLISSLIVQFLTTAGLTFGIVFSLLFLPAMVLINAVVDPDFLMKLRVRS
jgi:hypothetical protein